MIPRLLGFIKSTFLTKLFKSNENSFTLTRPLKVFLCYAVEDEAKVIGISERLKQDGVQPWVYKNEAVAGRVLRQTINEAVEDSDAVIIFLSQISVIKKGFIQEEIRSILRVAEKKPAEGIFLIPAKLEECQVPPGLDTLVWVELYQSDGYDRMRRSLWECAKFYGLVPNPAQTGTLLSSAQENIQDEASKVEQTRIFQQPVSVVGPVHPAQAQIRPVIEVGPIHPAQAQIGPVIQSVVATVLIGCFVYVTHSLRPDLSNELVFALSGVFSLIMLLPIYISFRINRNIRPYIWLVLIFEIIIYVFGLQYTNSGYQSPNISQVTERTTSTETIAANATHAPTFTVPSLSTAITSDPTATNTEIPIVTPATPTVAPTSATTQPTALPAPDAVVNNSDLNLRRGPSTQYGIIKSYQLGETVKIKGKDTKGKWLVVQMSDGNTGWISAAHLTINISLSDVPVIKPPPTPTLRPASRPPPTRVPPTAAPTATTLVEPATSAPLPTPTVVESTPTSKPRPRPTPKPTPHPTPIPP
jgi:uncharacterized protein YraI